MAAMLEELGMEPVPSADEAEVVIINTCSIRQKAEHKLYSALGKLRLLKQSRPELIAIVTGCVAQQEKQKLLKKAPHLDAVIGTHKLAELPRIVGDVRSSRRRVASTDFSSDVASLHYQGHPKNAAAVTGFVTIMQGCSNFCTYCVVPYTRGPEQSRPIDDIIAEAEGLVEKGVREITLLGQNVNAYGKDLNGKNGFPLLLRRLDEIPKLARIRFTTSHPRDFSEELADAMAQAESVCRHIHLPLQSGSDKILREMNRGYDFATYLSKIEILRDRIPNTAVTADIIVGFPGETREDFEMTLSALKQVRFDQIFSFKYSSRPGTAALKIPGHLDEDLKAERLAEIHVVQEQITADYHKAAEGTVEEVLVEGSRDDSDQLFGRTQTNKIVNFPRDPMIRPGDLVKVEILKGLKHSLLGRLYSHAP